MKNVVIISLALVVVDIIAPSGNTKKFIKLISGFIIIIVISKPLLNIVNSNFLNENLINKSVFTNNEAKYASSNNNYDKWQQKKIIEIYKNKISNKIYEILNSIFFIKEYNLNLKCEEDFNKENVGEILNLEINILRIKNKAKNSKEPRLEKEQIEIIKKNISEYFKIDSSKISIFYNGMEV